MRIKATMERRILVNYRVDPGALAAVLPPPFRPVLVDGHGIAGICLIRLGGIRPAGVPAALGVTSESAAHRVAVEWDTPEGAVRGVYIHRRDTSSRLSVLVGGRLFPGWHHPARFRVEEAVGAYRVDLQSRDGTVDVAVRAHVARRVMDGSVFNDIEQASAFFREAPVGYSVTPAAAVFDGVALTTDDWAIAPLELDEVRSSFFDALPAVPDSAFLMSGLATTWHPQPALHGSAGPRHEHG